MTILHPGHLVGPGWAPVNPAGNFNPGGLLAVAAGQADPASEHWDGDGASRPCRTTWRNASSKRSSGAAPHWVRPSTWCLPAALTLRGYAERVSDGSGIRPSCSSCPGKSGGSGVTEREAAVTWDHIAHSPNCSIAKARTLLGYEPRYSSLEAVRESLDWLIEHGVVGR